MTAVRGPSPAPRRRLPLPSARSAVAGVYTTAEVARILGIESPRVRRLARAGLCRPGRRQRFYQFSFHDLVLLRAALPLLRAKVPPRKVRETLHRLQKALSPGQPLTAVRICADGRDVVVRDGRAAWEPTSGQMRFVFDVGDLARTAGIVKPATRPARPPAVLDPHSASEWFDCGLALERDDPGAARAAYERAIQADPELVDAHINLARLLHQAGELEAAIRLYRIALQRAPEEPILHYNLALCLEDAGETSAATLHYQRAIEIRPEFADAHFNLARLLERQGSKRQALRHLMVYRKLRGDG